MSPSREYTATACLRSRCARSAGAPAAEEGAHARAEFLRLQLRAENARLLLDACEQLAAVAAQQAPRGRNRFRRLLCHGTRQRPCLFQERSLLGHAVDEPEAVRGRGVEGLAEEQQFRGALLPDETRQQQRAAG